MHPSTPTEPNDRIKIFVPIRTMSKENEAFQIKFSRILPCEYDIPQHYSFAFSFKKKREQPQKNDAFVTPLHNDPNYRCRVTRSSLGWYEISSLNG